MTVKDITNLIDSPTPADISLIEKAYNVAEKSHLEQKRLSGESYFVHFFSTGKILAELKMDSATIAAGLLHGSFKYATIKEEDLKKEFGDEILFLVNGVTRLDKLKYYGAERHIESLRKLFVASAQDIRVLIIKLADRLHNMRTLQFMSPEKQKRIALETLEIFAPLAYRLGIRKLSKELEDLSFPYIYPEEYKKVQELIKLKREETLPRLEKFMKSIKKAMAENGLTNIQTDYRQNNREDHFLGTQGHSCPA